MPACGGVRRQWITHEHPSLSIQRQCELIGLSRSSYYFEPQGESAENLALMRRIDEIYTKRPFLGARKITNRLRRDGHKVNHKRVERLMRKMGLAAICPRPRTSKPAPGHRIYPYLLRDVEAKRPNQIWSSDITYIRLTGGFIYLVAVMDWFSRYVLSWEVSVSMEADFCLSAVDWALQTPGARDGVLEVRCDGGILEVRERLLATGARV